MKSVYAALLLAWVLLTSGCVYARNFQSPSERINPHTAYAEHRRARVDADLLSADGQQFVANVGLRVAAVRSRLDFGINLAHGAIGVVSTDSKFTVVDRRWFGLGGRVGLTYVNPKSIWVLPPALRDALGSFNLLSVPVELWTSFPLAHWFAFHLGLSYQNISMWGSFRADALLADATIAERSFAVTPHVNFFVARRIALVGAIRLPVSSQILSEIDTEVELADDLRAGIRSVEWTNQNFGNRLRFNVGAETRFGRNTHLRLMLNFGAFRPLDILVVSPSLSLYWRFR
jgi:hypothetical protein